MHTDDGKTYYGFQAGGDKLIELHMSARTEDGTPVTEGDTLLSVRHRLFNR